MKNVQPRTGLRRVIATNIKALATVVADDFGSRKNCMWACERHLVVLSSSEIAFRRALRDLGYLLAASEAPFTQRRVIDTLRS